MSRLLAGAILVAALVSPPRIAQASSAPLFESSFLAIRESVYPGLGHPLAIGDVNGDHAPDLVVVRGQPWGPYNNVALFLGDGYGGFAKPVALDGPLSQDVWGVTLADLDRNGRLDLVFSSRVDTLVYVRLGQGDGSFDPVRSYAGFYRANSVSVGDMNEDGMPDLVVGQGSFGSGYSILTGDGAGHFVRSFRGDTYCTTQSVLTDLDGDGHLDIVNTDIAYMAGNGQGGILTPRLSGRAIRGTVVAVADLDGDGNRDLVTADYMNSSQLAISFGAAGGRFDGSRDYRMELGESPRSVLVRDLDGDGRPEVIVGGSHIRIYVSDATGHLQLRRELPAPGASPAIECADVDGDGRPDLVAASADAIGIYLTGPGGTYRDAPSTLLDGRPGAAVRGEFSGDSNADVAVLLPSANAVDVLHGRPDGTMVLASKVDVGAGPRDLVNADFDHDGRDDLAVADSVDGSVTILRQLSDHTWQRSDVAGLAGARWLVASDVDRDGWPDLVTQDGNTGDVFVLPGSAAGPGAPVLAASPSFPAQTAAVADFDGDGDPDLMLVREDGEVRFLQGSTGNSFVSMIAFHNVETFRGITGAKTFDFGPDGRADGILSGAEGYALIHNNGSWSFNGGWLATGNLNGGVHGTNRVVLGDVDTDGSPELVASLNGRPYVSVFRMSPVVPFEDEVWSYGFGPTVEDAVLLADVTGDGLEDLVVTDPDGQRLWVAPHVSAPSTGVPAPSGPTANLAFRGSVPNPVRGEASLLRFDRLAPGRLRVDVLDARGRIVRRLFDDAVKAGATSFAWNGRDDGGGRVAPGVYFARATQAGDVATGKVVVLP